MTLIGVVVPTHTLLSNSTLGIGRTVNIFLVVQLPLLTVTVCVPNVLGTFIAVELLLHA